MAAEILRISTAPGAAPILDLADGQTYSYVPDSLQIDPGSGNVAGSSAGATTWQASQVDERYGGANLDWETRANAVLSWQQVIHATNVGSPAAALTAELDRADPSGQRFVEWCPRGFTNSKWFERRGPASWTIEERWDTGDIAVINVAMPVAPYALGAPITITPAGQALPAVFSLGTVSGDYWAQVDVSIPVPASTPQAWGLISAFQGGYGVFEAEAATPATGGWAITADASARGGNVLEVATPTPGTAYGLAWTLDPASVALNAAEMESDISVEVWLRIKTGTWQPSQITLTAVPPFLMGASRQSLDYGAAGKQFYPASAWRLYRAGTLRLPADTGGAWGIVASITPGPGSSGPLSVDWALIVPSRWRASSPSDVQLDSTYPSWIPSYGAGLTKRIAHDLSGTVGPTGTPMHASTGLGGSPLYAPPGLSSLLIASSGTVPDDSSLVSTDALGFTVAPTITITPRYGLLANP